MPLSGKYDFKGIKKFGAKGLLLALETVPVVGKLLKWGLRAPLEILLEWCVNWLANKGLVVLNIAAIAVEGEWDQKQFDDAMERAFKQIEAGGGKLTPEQIKAIDDEVIKAARRFIVITKHN